MGADFQPPIRSKKMARLSKSQLIEKLEDIGLEFNSDGSYSELYDLYVESSSVTNVVTDDFGQKTVVESKKIPGRPNPNSFDDKIKSQEVIIEKYRNHKGQTFFKKIEITKTKKGSRRRLISVEKE